MTKFRSILLLAALLLTACNPLRNVQRNQKADSTIVDRSDIRKIVSDIIRESGTMTQTIVEYYPPVEIPDKDPEGPAQHGPPATAAEPSTISHPPAIKRVVHTRIETEREKTSTTDSTVHNNITATARSQLSDKVVEKPPSSVTAIKWIAVGLVAVLLILVILKFSKIKIPGIK